MEKEKSDLKIKDEQSEKEIIRLNGVIEETNQRVLNLENKKGQLKAEIDNFKN